MGFSNVAGQYRPKRGGCETATQRKKRRYRTGDKETAQDIRVVKKQKSERAVGDRRKVATSQLLEQCCGVRQLTWRTSAMSQPRPLSNS